MSLNAGREIKIAILEDEELLRGLLAEWLSSLRSLTVVDQFRSIEAFNAAIETSLMDVDLLLVDVRLPDGDGIEAISRIRTRRNTLIPAVVISGHFQPRLFDRLSSTLDSGWAFLYKDSNGLSSLMHSIEAVLDGLVMIDPRVRGVDATFPGNSLLTPQEDSIMNLVSIGKSNASIAAELYVSEKTVERALTSIYSKFGLIGVSKVVNPRVRATLLYRNLVD